MADLTYSTRGGLSDAQLARLDALEKSTRITGAQAGEARFLATQAARSDVQDRALRVAERGPGSIAPRGRTRQHQPPDRRPPMMSWLGWPHQRPTVEITLQLSQPAQQPMHTTTGWTERFRDLEHQVHQLDDLVHELEQTVHELQQQRQSLFGVAGTNV